MKFKEYINEIINKSIDDHEVVETLNGLGIFFERLKEEDNTYTYQFDNRYMLKYDGSVLKLYRQGNKIHIGNARNFTEISDTLSSWSASYELNQTELTDDDLDDLTDETTDKPKEEK